MTKQEFEEWMDRNLPETIQKKINELITQVQDQIDIPYEAIIEMHDMIKQLHMTNK